MSKIFHHFAAYITVPTFFLWGHFIPVFVAGLWDKYFSVHVTIDIAGLHFKTGVVQIKEGKMREKLPMGISFRINEC